MSDNEAWENYSHLIHNKEKKLDIINKTKEERELYQNNIKNTNMLGVDQHGKKLTDNQREIRLKQFRENNVIIKSGQSSAFLDSKTPKSNIVGFSNLNNNCCKEDSHSKIMNNQIINKDKGYKLGYDNNNMNKDLKLLAQERQKRYKLKK